MLDPRRALLYTAAAVALSLTGALLVVGSGSPAPEGEGDVSAAAVAEVERTPARSGGPAAEGIAVHGHWTIEVREPDGELVTRRQFENALVSVGARTLVRLMARQESMGEWWVSVGDSSDDHPCVDDSSGVPHTCVLIESGSTTLEFFPTLTVVADLTDPSELALSGTATATRNGRIDEVSTATRTCPADTSPSACPEDSGRATRFFSHSDVAPIEVLEGQAILVTVRISFS